MNTHTHFEQQKNVKALGITVLITGAICLIFFLISWTLPQLPPEPLNEGVEVNFGNIDEGLGDIAPAVPGELSVAKQSNYNPSPSIKAVAETQKEVAENNEADATSIISSAKPEKKLKPVLPTNNNTTAKNTTVLPVVKPVPPKPKAVYAGEKNTSSGGNNSDSYNNRNQGVAGGNGDQGKPSGNPNSDSYNGSGGTGTGGVSISDGLAGRKLAGSTRFQDEYRYGGKVLVNVIVDETGTVKNAKLKLGSAFADINSIAIKRAYQLKFTKGSETQTGTVTILFQNPKD